MFIDKSIASMQTVDIQQYTSGQSNQKETFDNRLGNIHFFPSNRWLPGDSWLACKPAWFGNEQSFSQKLPSTSSSHPQIVGECSWSVVSRWLRTSLSLYDCDWFIWSYIITMIFTCSCECWSLQRAMEASGRPSSRKFTKTLQEGQKRSEKLFGVYAQTTV